MYACASVSACVCVCVCVVWCVCLSLFPLSVLDSLSVNPCAVPCQKTYPGRLYKFSRGANGPITGRRSVRNRAPVSHNGCFVLHVRGADRSACQSALLNATITRVHAPANPDTLSPEFSVTCQPSQIGRPLRVSGFLFADNQLVAVVDDPWCR